MKKLAILGSTGSIGRQTLDVVRRLPGRFEVTALAAGNNTELLLQQAREFRPSWVSSPALRQDHETYAALKSLRAQAASMEDMASLPEIEMVVVATAGKAGLSPSLHALRHGKQIALANKEVLVMAGELVKLEMEKNGGRILPVDSEHSAIWQCLAGENEGVSRLVLTASGGPFRGASLERLHQVSPEEALKHPTWAMGPKVTVDSATLMNKGLEVIEAHWLFNIPLDCIDVLVHRESIIHSMVEFVDGSTKAQLSYPDMRLPIQYALCYPDRLPGRFVSNLDLIQVGCLTFDRPDLDAFRCLSLARWAAVSGGTHPAVLCGADEVAVDLFLRGEIGFMDIPRLVAEVLERHAGMRKPALDDILEADAWARKEAAVIAGRMKIR